jgi:hypothetical protein
MVEFVDVRVGFPLPSLRINAHVTHAGYTRAGAHS